MNDFETIYRQHAAALLRFAWGLSGDRSTAEDLVSETFVRILTRAPKLETRTALAYLLAAVRNTWLTGQRRRRREVPLPDDLPEHRRDPADDLDDQARMVSVLKAFDGLEEGQRAALLLRVDHELPYDDVAAALGISVSAAKVRVHRARLHLTRILDDEGDDMNGNVTRDVVNDLWPLCEGGEASVDSRRLVDDFLTHDRAFADELRRSADLSGAMPAMRLSPGAEREMLDQARERARWKLMVIGGSIGMVGFISLAALIGAMLLVFRA